MTKFSTTVSQTHVFRKFSIEVTATVELPFPPEKGIWMTIIHSAIYGKANLISYYLQNASFIVTLEPVEDEEVFGWFDSSSFTISKFDKADFVVVLLGEGRDEQHVVHAPERDLIFDPVAFDKLLAERVQLGPQITK